MYKGDVKTKKSAEASTEAAEALRARDRMMYGNFGLPGFDPTLPVLVPSNLVAFKKAMSNKGLIDYPALGDPFRTGVFTGYPEEEYVSPLLGQDPGGIKLARFKAKDKARLELLFTMEHVSKPKFFAQILGNMSAESLARVSAYTVIGDDGEFIGSGAEIIKSRDLLGLIKVISATHVSTITGDLNKDILDAEKRYHNLAQGKMPILDYFQHFKSSIDAITGLGEDAPPRERQVAHFLGTLDHARYATLQVQLQNGTMEYPKTLDSAFARALNWKVVAGGMASKADGSSEPAAVYVTTADMSRPYIKTASGKKGKSKASKKPAAENTSGKSSGGGEKKQAPNPSKKPSQSRFAGTCDFCGLPGHKCKDCFEVKKIKAKMMNGTVAVTFAEEEESKYCSTDSIFMMSGKASAAQKKDVAYKRDLGQFDVLLDNQATTGIFHEARLLSNVRKASHTMRINGVSAVSEESELKTDQIGDVVVNGDVLATVWYHASSRANIIPLGSTEESFTVVHTPRSHYTIHMPGGYEVVFSKQWSDHHGNGLYVSDFQRHVVSESSTVLVNTVAYNKLKYTQRDIKAADEAAELYSKLGYASRKDIDALLRGGGILNAPSTVHDFHRANQIYGPDIASLKGRTVQRKSQKVKVEFLPPPVEIEQTGHVDLMHVLPSGGGSFLVSIFTPLYLTVVSHLKGNSKSYAVVKEALFAQIASLSKRGFLVKTILSDGEGAVSKMETDLNARGIVLNPSGPGQHVALIERTIRQVKERLRSHTLALPFFLNRIFLVWLVLFVVSRINLMPRSERSDSLSPREAFTGRKLDYKLDLRVGFGDYLHTTTPNISFKNEIQTSRTDEAIALFPTGNLSGTIAVYNLATGRVVKRDQFVKLPMPDSVVNHLNTLSDEPKLRVPRDIVFKRGGIAIEGVESSDLTLADESAAVNLEPPRLVVADREYIEDPLSVEDIKLFADDEHADLLEKDAELPVDKRSEDAVPQGLATSAHTETALPPPAPPDQSRGANQPVRVAEVPSGHQYGTRRQTRLLAVDTANALTAEESVADSHKVVAMVEGDSKHMEQVFHVSVKKALKTFPKSALKAMILEIEQMIDKKVWTPVKLRNLSKKQLKSIVKSTVFLKEKYLSTGEFDKLKARLVARGDMQDKSLYDNISSPTVSTSTILIVAALAAKEGRRVVTVDVGGAYLNAKLNQEVLMQLDPTQAAILVNLHPEYRDFMEANGTITVRLLQALYGCVESAQLWYEHLKAEMVSLGYTVNPIDPCLFNKVIDGIACTVCVYVDDLMFTCKDANIIAADVAKLKEKFGEVAVKEGLVHSYVGMTFNFEKPEQVAITMEGYTREMLKLYGVTGKAATPALPYLFDIRDSPLLLKDQNEEFHSRVAKLLFLAKRTRPEMLPLVTFLATRVHVATEDDWSKLERGLKYLNTDPDIGIILRPSRGGVGVDAFIDASYGVHSDGKSHSGLWIAIGAGPVFVKSSKQKIVAKSSTEAELIAVSDGFSQVIWSRDLLLSLGYDVAAATVYQDNLSTMAMVENGRSTSERTRHINVRYFFVKDRVESGEINIQHLPTEKMIADGLTKPLQGEAFRAMRRRLLNWEF